MDSRDNTKGGSARALQRGGPASPRKRIDIWHNILWSRYKGLVFSELADLSRAGPYDLRFYHVAETKIGRVSLDQVEPLPS